MLITAIMRAVCLFAIIYFAFRIASYSVNNRDKFAALTAGAINRALGKSKSYYFNPDNITSILSKYGAMAMFHDYYIEPSAFIMVKIMCGAALLLIGFFINVNILGRIGFIVGGALLGFWLPDILLWISNAEDKNNMADDILEMYDILKIYTKAGSHIKDALIECQIQVKNSRLKEGLQELNNNILSGQVMIGEAVDIFNARFADENIDDFCVILKQALVTGRSTKILADLSRQLYDTRKAVAILEREKMERKMQIIQLLFFIGLSILLIYLICIELINSVNNF